MLGEGSVGKTSLVERLLFNQSPSNKGKTVGVDIHRWDCEPDKKYSKSNTQESVCINIWDFGGQEIYHATHQFFLTQRSLYLVVIDARQDEGANRLDYWLRHAQSFGGESPIILVVNKIDQGQRPLDERGLLARYPTLRAICHTSCINGNGIINLHETIQQTILRLSHVHDVVPKTWIAIKERLSTLDKDYLPYEQFVDICQTEGVMSQIAQRTLARFLHDLGTVLNFQDDQRLEDTHILKGVPEK